MLETVIYPLLRHSLQWLGAYVAVTSYASGEDVELAIGVMMSLSAVLWSICKRTEVSSCQH